MLGVVLSGSWLSFLTEASVLFLFSRSYADVIAMQI